MVYQKLALLSHRQGISRWKLLPKVHCVVHLAEDALASLAFKYNCKYHHCFKDEDKHRPSKKVGSDGGQTPYGMANPFEVAIAIGIMDPRNRRMMKFQLQILFSWPNLTNKKSLCVDYNLGTCSSRSYTSST